MPFARRVYNPRRHGTDRELAGMITARTAGFSRRQLRWGVGIFSAHLSVGLRFTLCCRASTVANERNLNSFPASSPGSTTTTASLDKLANIRPYDCISAAARRSAVYRQGEMIVDKRGQTGEEIGQGGRQWTRATRISDPGL
jgi:hypothetical protein